MEKVDVKIKVLKEGCLPEYKHVTDACADCRANIDCEVTVEPWGKLSIPLGFALELPDGWKAEILPRSGLTRDKGTFAVTGTIDQGYVGEVQCTLINHTNIPLHVKGGDRVCQIGFTPYYHASFTIVDKLKETERGENGFGSTGIK